MAGVMEGLTARHHRTYSRCTSTVAIRCMIHVQAPPEGLRERKKRAARQAIATTARRLFADRGFDAVTVAEVAAAADVSEKTVFNHFPTKEHLAFAGREEGIAQFVTAIAERGP